MKNLKLLMILLAGTFTLAGCSPDTDSNPIYQQPETFVLNTPGYATTVFDLENSKVLTLTCTQPDYGFTAATTYAVQLSLTNTWTDETAEAPATYETLSSVSTAAKIPVDAVEMAKIIVRLAGWKSEQDFAGNDMDVYVRLSATIASSLLPVYSNTVKLKVLPYYIELKDAAPSFFFLIGNLVGGWDLGFDKIGISTIPMSLEKGYEYDKKTGAGQFTFTGYFEAATKDNGFKLIGMLEKDGKKEISWGEQWGNGEDGDLPGNTKLVHLHNGSGNPGHLGVSEAGWYKIVVNDKDQTLKFNKLDGEPHAPYTSIQLLGTFSEWDKNAVEMTNIGNMTHSWKATVTFTKPENVKFRANKGWDVNWGSDAAAFPFGLGAQGEKDIPVQPGTYVVTFNDIEGSYCFFAL